MTRLRIGTRGSPLALWQAEQVAAAVARRDGPACEIVIIQTSGDRLAQARLSDVGGKRLFVKEIEEALVEQRIDLAVHSAKDLPADRVPGLAIAAALPRGDPHDAVVTPDSTPDDDPARDLRAILAPGADRPRVGTGSIRRTAQLRHAFPDLDLAPIRGNVGTRLRKLDDGAYDLLVLATAGLVRLKLADRVRIRIPFDICVPAPGQGIVVGEYRAHDVAIADLLETMTDRETAAALAAERAVVTALGADCQVPVGAVAVPSGDELVLRGVVAATDGAHLVTREARRPWPEAAALGREVAERLIAGGADALLAAARSQTG